MVPFGAVRGKEVFKSSDRVPTKKWSQGGNTGCLLAFKAGSMQSGSVSGWY